MEPLQPSRWARLSAAVHTFLRDDHGVRYFFIALGLIVTTGVCALVIIQPTIVSLGGLTLTPKPPEAPKYYSPLTGVEVKNSSVPKRQVTAIMIENSPDARPQSGLKDAGVVFEAIAEGGITRFAALYQETKPQLIGPVRSVRPYYLSWIKPFDAAVAHIGGSANALAEVRGGEYKDIDQFFNSGAYWRATDRYAPHNVYTSFAKLDALNASKKYTTSKFKGFTRTAIPKKNQTTTPSSGLPKATNIGIDISSSLYNPSYVYDAKKKVYKRSLDGVPHVDREKGLITPKVVIAMKVVTTIELEDGYREQMKSTGSGNAYIFQNGTVVKGLWHKKSKNSQLSFTDKEGRVVPLNRGQTWITALPSTRNVTWH